MNLPPYPKYKPSGVEWIGNVPEHWEVKRLRTTTENVIDQTNQKADWEIYIALEHVESWTGRIHEYDSDVVFESQVKKFRFNDILFGKLRPYLAKIARPSTNGVCVGEFLVLRPRNGELTPNYLEYLLRSKPMIDLISASTFGAKMPRTDWQFIGKLLHPLPPLSEQIYISDFLVITKDSEDWSDIAVPALVTETASDLVCGYHLAIIRRMKLVLDSHFAFRLLQAESVNQQFQVAATGVTRYGIPKSSIGEAHLPVPPLPEQRAIADFIDRETARVDDLIVKTEAVIERLREYRSAIIDAAVTGKIDTRTIEKPENARS